MYSKFFITYIIIFIFFILQIKCLLFILVLQFSFLRIFFFVIYVNFCFTYPRPSFINLFVQYSQSDLPPLSPICGKAPG